MNEKEKGNVRPILVKLKKIETKNVVMMAKKEMHLNCSLFKYNEIALGTERDGIYINEELTPMCYDGGALSNKYTILNVTLLYLYIYTLYIYIYLLQPFN